MKRVFTSAIMGVLALCAVHFTTTLTGVSLPINPLSLCVGSALGIPGVITMLIIGQIIK